MKCQLIVSWCVQTETGACLSLSESTSVVMPAVLDKLNQQAPGAAQVLSLDRDQLLSRLQTVYDELDSELLLLNITALPVIYCQR